MHQSTTPSLSLTIWPRWTSRQFLSLHIVQTLLPVTFGHSLSSKAVIMRQLRRWKRLWRRSLTRSHKRTSMVPSRSCWNGTSALQPEEITLKGTRVCVLLIKVPIWKKSGNLFIDPYIYVWIYLTPSQWAGYDTRSIFNQSTGYLVKLATLVEGDLKAPFSIATTPRCRGGYYSISWIASLYPWSLTYNAEC